jgi:hypothetical protein
LGPYLHDFAFECGVSALQGRRFCGRGGDGHFGALISFYGHLHRLLKGENIVR